MLIVNPGSGAIDTTAADGWTNTREGACVAAERWLEQMRAAGIADVELVESDALERDGRWSFTFRHTVTGVTAALETHGISDLAAHERQHLFAPRVYWCGSSSANPKLSDFAAPGFVMTFRPEDPR